MLAATIELAERGWLPDAAIRLGIRQLLASRLHDERRRVGSSQHAASLSTRLAVGELVEHADDANRQHYEVPVGFFQQMLGCHLKYSCAYWTRHDTKLDDAEAAMLALTCERAEIEDGMRILELGCGWGSLSLWLAERYPQARITALSNSHSQRQYIEHQCRERGLKNLHLVTCNIAHFQTVERFDRVVSVEMFEHVRNHRQLLASIADWLSDQGKLFVHVFCHREMTYLFQPGGAANWMAQHFFTGGMMPSVNWLEQASDRFRCAHRWQVNGNHYRRTADAWLARLDAHRPELVRVLAQQIGSMAATRQFHRWRIFLMACSELFGYRGGEEWFVAHYLMVPTE